MKHHPAKAGPYSQKPQGSPTWARWDRPYHRLTKDSHGSVLYSFVPLISHPGLRCNCPLYYSVEDSHDFPTHNDSTPSFTSEIKVLDMEALFRKG